MAPKSPKRESKSPKQSRKESKSPRSSSKRLSSQSDNLPRLTNDKQNVFNAIEQEANALNDIGHDIWRYCEAGGKELQSCKRIVDFLKNKGFDIIELSQDFDTAFRAEFGQNVNGGKPHPNIGFLCEYHADPLTGHSHGHNLVTVNSLAAAIGLQSAIRFSKKRIGMVTVVGCPSDPNRPIKKKMLESDCFQGIDFLLTAYPAHFTCLEPQFLANKKVHVTFQGRGVRDGVKEPWEAANPVNAVVLTQQNLSSLRQTFPPDWFINGVIPSAGKDPCIQPSKATSIYELKSHTINGISVLTQKLQQCLEGAAATSGCQFTIMEMGTPLVNNVTCARYNEIYRENAKLNGFTFYQERKELFEDPNEISFITRSIPTFNMFYYAGTAAQPGSDEFNRYCGSPEAEYMSIVQGKSLAMMAVDLMKERCAMSDVMKEYQDNVRDIDE